MLSTSLEEAAQEKVLIATGKQSARAGAGGAAAQSRFPAQEEKTNTEMLTYVYVYTHAHVCTYMQREENFVLKGWYLNTRVRFA